MQGAFGSKIRQISVVLAAAVLLSGCLSEEKADEIEDTSLNVNVTGSVGDGPVVGASMRIVRNDGEILERFESDTFADFNITVRTLGRHYPLTIEARDGIDLVTNLAPDFTLFGTVTAPEASVVANVNPFSTFAVEIARDLPGGYTADNVAEGERLVTDWFNSGLRDLRSSGPLTTPINSSNVAEVVKTSEVLSETVRRTRNLLQIFGNTTTANQVIRALSSDLGDGIVDGQGGSRTDARTAAISTVASAQVLLEAMANELHVDGRDATGAMNDAVVQINAGTPQKQIADLTVTAEMLRLVRIGLAGAYHVSDSPKLQSLQQSVAGLQPGMDPNFLKTFLPSDYRETLDNVLMAVAGGDISVINAINSVARNGGEQPEPNRAPTISGTPSTSAETGVNYLFTPTTSDPDGDALVFTISGLPAWASFRSATGTLSGIPIAADVGTYNDIVITATDGLETVSLPAFSITVVMGNTAPVISGSPASSVNAGSQYSFTPTASDADGDTLSFAIANKPVWADFNTGTGRLSGTPANSNARTYDNIVISVSDGKASIELPPFGITVVAVSNNRAPTISGSPAAQVNANSAYSFTPTASDPDGDSLSFTVSNLPSWASFDDSNGRISGTPGDADVGSYDNIRITVSDGEASATLGPFSIMVGSVTLGSVTLNWTPPTENDDGSALTDLAGYRIYWGTAAGSYPNSITIDNPGISSYVVENLVPGTYEFVATSFNAAGVESIYSNPATKTVQ